MNTGTKIGFAISLLALSIGTAVAAGPSKGPANPAVDPSALARAEAKFAAALAVVDQFKAQAAAEGITGDAWRFQMVGNLMQGSEANFASVSLARSYADAVSAAKAVARAGNPTSSSEAASGSSAASVTAGLGTTTSDLVYVPITPCRVLDTRAGGAAVAANTVKTYDFTAINVGAASCSVTNQIPGSDGAAAFAANVTVDESGLSGFGAGSYLQIYPQGGSTATSFMNFSPNQIIANAGVISLNQANGQFSVVSNAPTQIIVDTYGAFIAPQPTAVECTTATSTSSFLGVVSATCPAGYGMTGGGCHSNSINDWTYENFPSGATTWGCGFWTSGTLGTTLTAYAQCCRVPGRP